MARREISEYALYRWRFVLGYVMVGLLLAGLLYFAGTLVPGGLSDPERAATVTSASISFTNLDTLAVIHLPYHLLQAGIFELFGVSEFTIKLPSLILGFLSAIGLIVLLRRWFPPSIAVFASLIAIATSQFLFIAQSGYAGILYIFWPVTLLFLGTMVTRSTRLKLLWKLLFAAAAALSLYSPLGIYMLLAIAITVILHPHLRNIIRRLSKVNLAFAIGLALILIAPLVYFIIRDPSLLMTLLIGNPEWLGFTENLRILVNQYVLFWEPTATRILVPIFGLGAVLLIALGFYRLIKTRETTRSYLLISWIACLLPILVINPQFVTVTFVPAVMLLAAGLTTLIGYWYRLFPYNPYARVAGLIPIAVLVGALLISGVDHYFYGYHYSPTVSRYFNPDLSLLPKDTENVVVSEKEKPFYDAVAKYRDDLTVSTKPTGDSFAATRDGRTGVEGSYDVTRIITSRYSNDADRFYLYQKTQN